MAISFNDLPTKRDDIRKDEDDVIRLEKGRYFATITKAEIRESKTTGTPYMNLTLDVQDKVNPMTTHKVYDIISESSKSVARYKLSRLLVAIKVDQYLRNQTFELPDLVKLVKDKHVQVDITMEEPKDSAYKARPIVDCFAGEIYYTPEDGNKEELPALGECPFDLSENQIPEEDNIDDLI